MSELIEMDVCNYMRGKVMCLVNNHNNFHYKFCLHLLKRTENEIVCTSQSWAN